MTDLILENDSFCFSRIMTLLPDSIQYFFILIETRQVIKCCNNAELSPVNTSKRAKKLSAPKNPSKHNYKVENGIIKVVNHNQIAITTINLV